MDNQDLQNIQKQIDDLKSQFDDFNKRKKSSIEEYELLRVYKLYAGLPVFTAARGDNPKQGEIYIIDTATKRICAYISGTQYCVTIT